MYTVKKIADITNISPRTVRDYDSINLPSPTEVNEVVYRFYDESCIDI